MCCADDINREYVWGIGERDGEENYDYWMERTKIVKYEILLPNDTVALCMGFGVSCTYPHRIHLCRIRLRRCGYITFYSLSISPILSFTLAPCACRSFCIIYFLWRAGRVESMNISLILQILIYFVNTDISLSFDVHLWALSSERATALKFLSFSNFFRFRIWNDAEHEYAMRTRITAAAQNSISAWWNPVDDTPNRNCMMALIARCR